MDPHHVSWMNDDIFDRMLFALRDKLPEKVLKDANVLKKYAVKEKLLVDVYRGTDFSLAYYLKRTPETHMVLLKDKQMVYPEGQLPSQITRKELKVRPVEMVDLTGDDTNEAAPSGEASTSNLPFRDDDEIKDGREENRVSPGMEDEKQDDEEKNEKSEEKPKLRVDYTGFKIYRKALIVVIQPFPDFKADQVDNRPFENNQLSASVQPEALQRASSSSSRLSATPAPSNRQGGGALFRSRSRSYTAQLDDEETRDSGNVEPDKEGTDTDDEDDLPPLDDLLNASNKYSRT